MSLSREKLAQLKRKSKALEFFGATNAINNAAARNNNSFFFSLAALALS